MRDIPEHLANTLDSILGQLDVLTQTVSILEERMTLVENVIDKAFDPQRQVRNKPTSTPRFSCFQLSVMAVHVV